MAGAGLGVAGIAVAVVAVAVVAVAVTDDGTTALQQVLLLQQRNLLN